MHSAFWVKAVCSGLDDYCFNKPDWDVLNTGKKWTVSFPDSAEDGEVEFDACFTSLLEHERYNLAEGERFVNISYTLLEWGASFCTDPARDEAVAQWNTTLERAMKYHSSSHTFEEMSTAHLAQVRSPACIEPPTRAAAARTCLASYSLHLSSAANPHSFA